MFDLDLEGCGCFLIIALIAVVVAILIVALVAFGLLDAIV